MAIVIDGHAALAALRQAVAERGPSYSYQVVGRGCRYWHEETGEPGCIVGLALHKIGVSAETIKALDTAASSKSSLMAYALAQPEHRQLLGDVIITDAAALIFGAAQTHQDVGTPWGDVLVAAKVRATKVNLITSAEIAVSLDA